MNDHIRTFNESIHKNTIHKSKSIGAYICDKIINFTDYNFNNINNKFDYNYEEIFINDTKINYISNKFDEYYKQIEENYYKEQNKLLNKVIDKLESGNTLLTNNITDLKNNNKSLLEELNNCKDQNKLLNKVIDKLESYNTLLTNKITDIENNNKILTDIIDDCNKN